MCSSYVRFLLAGLSEFLPIESSGHFLKLLLNLMSIIVPLIWMLRESLIIVATNNEINKLHEAVYRKQKQVLM